MLFLTGSFRCSNNQLTSLKGSPKEIRYGFYCENNFLTNLNYLSEIVKGRIIYQNNPLTSLEGLSIYNLTKNLESPCYNSLNPKIREDWFDKHLEDNPEIISLINFPISKNFKNKWFHLFNANKFDLIYLYIIS